MQHRTGWTVPLGLLILLFFMVSSTVAFNAMDEIEKTVGWHWYNESVEEEIKPVKNSQLNMKNLSATKQLKILQQLTHELQAKAVLSGDPNDIANYKRIQDMWVNKATRFAIGWEKMLLQHPELDYSLKYSHENRLSPILFRKTKDQESESIARLSKENGLLFFYRGHDKADQLYSQFVINFAKTHHFVLLPVSVDGYYVEALSKQKISDVGHKRAEKLGVSEFPSIVLVNPKKKTHQVVMYGFHTEDEISERLQNIEDNWTAKF